MPGRTAIGIRGLAAAESKHVSLRSGFLEPMWPWGHLAAGYLLYSGYRRVRHALPPRPVQALVVALGTQVPDLVDKPLAWQVGLLPNGRSLGHSLLVAVPVLGVVWAYATYTGRRDLAGALSLGYLTHLFTDALYPALAGEWYYLGYLAWPAVPPIEYETGQSLLAHLVALELGATVVFEIALFVAATVVWQIDGRPGLGTVLGVLPSRGAPEDRPGD